LLLLTAIAPGRRRFASRRVRESCWHAAPKYGLSVCDRWTLPSRILVSASRPIAPKPALGNRHQVFLRGFSCGRFRSRTPGPSSVLVDERDAGIFDAPLELPPHLIDRLDWQREPVRDALAELRRPFTLI
jgi:hypothetical protein